MAFMEFSVMLSFYLAGLIIRLANFQRKSSSNIKQLQLNNKLFLQHDHVCDTVNSIKTIKSTIHTVQSDAA